jgi:hypothetical protein
MTSVRNDQIILRGLKDVLAQKGHIRLDELEKFLAQQTKRRAGDNDWWNNTDSSEIVRKFREDRYHRGSEEVPVALSSEKDIATFVRYASQLDDQGGLLGFGKNTNGDFAEPGHGTINKDTQLEQALVDDLTIMVNGSRDFDVQNLEGSLAGSQTQVETQKSTFSKSSPMTSNPATTNEVKVTVQPASLAFSSVASDGFTCVDSNADGTKERFVRSADGGLKPVIDVEGQPHVKMLDGSLKPLGGSVSNVISPEISTRVVMTTAHYTDPTGFLKLFMTPLAFMNPISVIEQVMPRFVFAA